MKRIWFLAAFSLIVFNSNLFALDSLKTNTSTKKSLNTLPTTATYIPAGVRKNPVTPPAISEDPQAIPEGYVDEVPPDRSSGDPKCPDGYYCKAVLGGTSVFCKHGDGIKECNPVAHCCNIGPGEDPAHCGMLDRDKYCKR